MSTAVVTTTEGRPGRAGRVERGERSGFSVRTRITAVVALLVTLALSGAGSVVYLVEARRIDHQIATSTDRQFDAFARFQRRNVDRYPTVRELLRAYLGVAVAGEDQALVAWYGGQAQLVSWHGYVGNETTFDRDVAGIVADNGSTTIPDPQDTLLVSAQTVRVGDQTGAFLVVAYDDDLRAPLVETMRTYAVVALLALLLSTALAYAQAGRLLAPLRGMRRTADAITDSDLSRRLPVAGNDDITALTRTVNRMLDRLERAFVGQRQFLDDAGHELRTPLTVLRGHLELLDVGSPDDIAETRELLLDEVDRMSRLVGELILLAKSDRPDFVTPRPVDVTALTVDVLAKARGLADRQWTLDATASVTASLDEQRITQALLQLADNAVKHTAAGDVVALGSAYDETPDGATVRLWVRDSGPGVAAADTALIFERFGRAHVPDDDDGFGLGLSIVAAIVDAHGGSVDVEPVTPHGARFVLALPGRPGRVEPTRGADREEVEPPVPSAEEVSSWPAS